MLFGGSAIFLLFVFPSFTPNMISGFLQTEDKYDNPEIFYIHDLDMTYSF